MSIVKTIIPAYNKNEQEPAPGEDFLEIAEFFYDTIQGEGAYVGVPAAFLRMQWCTQNCVWCDTQEVWRHGSKYSFSELFKLIDKTNIIEQLQNGQHLVLTGGSPLRQQEALVNFFREFEDRYEFLPIIQIENECTLMPSKEIIDLVSIWNNSPKLKNSGNPDTIRYRPEILRELSHLEDSYFKFVVTNFNDIDEIERDFLLPHLIKPYQVILMPQGATRAELESNREIVMSLAINYGFRYVTREHIVVWDKKTGV